MDRKTFDEGFKLFKRFLKEEGIYIPVMNFLFQHGRKKENLFKEFNSKKYHDVDDWKEVFSKTNLMCGYLYDLDLSTYYNLIVHNDLPINWQHYYNNAMIEKEKRVEEGYKTFFHPLTFFNQNNLQDRNKCCTFAA